jgi:hypothetical protein
MADAAPAAATAAPAAPLPFDDLEAYIAPYSAPAKLDRLLWIAEQSAGAPLELEALRLAGDDVKKVRRPGVGGGGHKHLPAAADAAPSGGSRPLSSPRPLPLPLVPKQRTKKPQNADAPRDFQRLALPRGHGAHRRAPRPRLRPRRVECDCGFFLSSAAPSSRAPPASASPSPGPGSLSSCRHPSSAHAPDSPPPHPPTHTHTHPKTKPNQNKPKQTNRELAAAADRAAAERQQRVEAELAGAKANLVKEGVRASQMALGWFHFGRGDMPVGQRPRTDRRGPRSLRHQAPPPDPSLRKPWA